MGLLWFRRGRGKDVRQEPEPELPEARPQSRLPLRLRGVLLLNLGPADGLAQIETAPPLGPMKDVVRILELAVPGISFDGTGKGEMRAVDHRFSIDLGGGPVVHTAVVAVEGDAAVEQLRNLMERQRWRAYAARAGVFIEPDALDLFALPDDAPPHSRI